MQVRAAILCVLGAAAVACGGGGGGPTTPTPGGSGVGATITITADGVTPKTVRIQAGQRVQFVNNNNRAHEVQSTPHDRHTDCPPVNEVAVVNPGQTRMTGALSLQGTCGFHDHRDPDNDRFRGTILIDVTDAGQPPRY
jgi:plastocyanin